MFRALVDHSGSPNLVSVGSTSFDLGHEVTEEAAELSREHTGINLRADGLSQLHEKGVGALQRHQTVVVGVEKDAEPVLDL